MIAMLALALIDGSAAPVHAPTSTEHGTASSRQQDDKPSVTRILVVDKTEDHDGRNRQRALDARAPGFSTAIQIDQERGTTHGDDLAQVLTRAPGVRVRSLGGLGQFSAVSLRGSAAQQVQMFIEGVPLNDGFGGLVDLSSQPLDALDRVEIHRGYVPIAYGGATLGGAIDLVGSPHRGDANWSGAVGYGSFGTREARASFATPIRSTPWSLGATASYGGSEGNFAFFDDGGTPRITDDDGYTERTNNDYNRVFAMLRTDRVDRRSKFSQQLRASWRNHGVPGTANVQSTDARQDIASLHGITRVDRSDLGRRAHELTWIVGLNVARRTYRDPQSQVGNGVDDELAWSFDGYLSPRLRLNATKWLAFALVADVRGESVDVDERNMPDDPQVLASGDALRWRWSSGTGVEADVRLFHERWRIVPAVRVDTFDSHFRVPDGEGQIGDEGVDRIDVAASPRLGTRVTLIPGIELRGSVGRYFRAPTMFELFGDRGFVVGNEGLRAERGTSVDGGLVFDVQHSRWSWYSQVAGFGTWSEDLIQFVQSGLVVHPINLPGAVLRGLEGSLGIQLFARTLELDANYTLLDTRNLSSETEQHLQPLPGRPRHEGSAKVALGHGFGTGWTRFEPRIAYLLDGTSSTSLDPSNRYRLPTRVFHGINLALHWAEGLHLSIEVRNLANLQRTSITPAAGPPTPVPVPVTDFIGYPLPGRSVFVRLAVDASLSHRRRGTKSTP